MIIQPAPSPFSSPTSKAAHACGRKSRRRCLLRTRVICAPSSTQVFRSLWERWNAFAPEAMRIHELWPSFASECILIDELTAVNTTHWKFAEGTRGAATGFTGAVGFSLISKSKIKKSWREYWVGSSTVLQSLARFAFFSGVGHHTTIGMGQCRPLPPLNSSTRNRLRQVYVHK